MLVIGVTLGGYWETLDPQAFLNWFAAYNPLIAKAISIIFLPTAVGVVGSLLLSWKTRERSLWIASALCIVVVTVMTFAYFVPANTAFANGGLEVTAVPAALSEWLNVHYLRIALAMIGSIIGVVALARSAAAPA